MRSARLVTALLWLCLGVLPAAAIPHHVTWTARLEPSDARVGEGAQIVVTAVIDPGWHIYSLTPAVGEGPPATTIELQTSGKTLTATAKAIEPTPQQKLDPGFQKNISYFEGSVAFGLPVRIASDAAGEGKAVVNVRFQACDAHICLPIATQEAPLTFSIAPGAARPERTAAVTSVPQQPAGSGSSSTIGASPSNPGGGPTKRQGDNADHRSLIVFLWFAFTAGLAALLTPCVFPMVPVTVSYFSKHKSDDGRIGIRGPLAYCLGIMGTFTALGIAVTLVFGATGLPTLATSAYFNLGLAILFTVMAANLFGVFEIVLPSSLINRAQTGTRRGGLVGPLLMGLTFTLTSFTCTVPFVSTTLISASQGNLLYPALGMLAFSTAFALPFFLLALFPQYLARMPKSGSWLTSVKAFMGFLELAAALKFLSNVDLVWQKGLLTRPVFLALWAAIAIVAALYLLGWMRLPHDGEQVKVGWVRRGLGIGMAAISLYLLSGINGAPLNKIVAFLPPDPYPGTHIAGETIPWISNYDQARTLAKSEQKLIFINFTGVTCTNCRFMENVLFKRPDVSREINQFVPVELYTDRPIPGDRENEQLRDKLTHVVANTVYAIVSPENEKVLQVFEGSTPDQQKFIAFLQAGRTETRTAGR